MAFCIKKKKQLLATQLLKLRKRFSPKIPFCGGEGEIIFVYIFRPFSRLKRRAPFKELRLKGPEF